MPTYLAEIVAAHRAAAAGDARDPSALFERALGRPSPSGFANALAGHAPDGLAVIAEVKRRSPSRGDLDAELDPGSCAAAYAAGGATGLSVLTDRDYFGGSPEDLAAARAASGLPVLRKDFTVCASDVCDTRLMGADAVLLIVAALADDELADLHGVATQLGLDVLVEVHDRNELARALGVGARVIGVNQRDLTTFEVDPHRAEELAPQIPAGVIAVAESGISGRSDAGRLAAAGYDAVLVGESVVRSADRAGAVAAIRGQKVGTRRARNGREGPRTRGAAATQGSAAR